VPCSLLLANIGPNSAMSPKIVNGSFAALFDNNDVIQVDVLPVSITAETFSNTS
jgi:hypothetical protein